MPEPAPTATKPAKFSGRKKQPASQKAEQPAGVVPDTPAPALKFEVPEAAEAKNQYAPPAPACKVTFETPEGFVTEAYYHEVTVVPDVMLSLVYDTRHKGATTFPYKAGTLVMIELDRNPGVLHEAEATGFVFPVAGHYKVCVLKVRQTKVEKPQQGGGG